MSGLPIVGRRLGPTEITTISQKHDSLFKALGQRRQPTTLDLPRYLSPASGLLPKNHRRRALGPDPTKLDLPRYLSPASGLLLKNHRRRALGPDPTKLDLLRYLSPASGLLPKNYRRRALGPDPTNSRSRAAYCCHPS